MEELIRGALQDVIHDKESTQREINVLMHSYSHLADCQNGTQEAIQNSYPQQKELRNKREWRAQRSLLCILHTSGLKFLYHLHVCFTFCNFIILSHPFQGQNVSPNYNEHWAEMT